MHRIKAQKSGDKDKQKRTSLLTTLPRTTTFRKLEARREEPLELEFSSTSSSASRAEAWRIESESWDNSSIASIEQRIQKQRSEIFSRPKKTERNEKSVDRIETL